MGEVDSGWAYRPRTGSSRGRLPARERLGGEAQTTFYQGLVDGSFFIADLHPQHYSRVLELNRKYKSLRLGFVDAAVLALAEHLGLGRVATTDRRHFGAVEIAVTPARGP